MRKRAIGCLHHMLRRVPSMHSHMEPHFRAALRCGDVGVIGAALHAYIDLVKVNGSLLRVPLKLRRL